MINHCHSKPVSPIIVYSLSVFIKVSYFIIFQINPFFLKKFTILCIYMHTLLDNWIYIISTSIYININYIIYPYKIISIIMNTRM